MKIVENQMGGLYDYTVTGEQEEAAAAELEQRMARISREYHNPYRLDDLADARRKVAEKYGVKIGATLD